MVCEGFYFLYRMNIKTPPLIILLKPSKVRMIMMDEASKRMMNEWMLFLPQGGVRRRPKKVPLSFSALARGALQAPGCAEDRHSPPAGPPEGRRRQWCARRNDANKFLQGQSGISGILAVSDLQSHHRAGGNHPRSFWDPLLHIKLGFQATTLLKRGT